LEFNRAGFAAALCLFLSSIPASDARAAGDYTSTIQTHVHYIVGHQLADGAIKDNSSYVMPYFANFAAIALARIPGSLPRVRAWLMWYTAHLNRTDIWGSSGSVYDYNVTKAATGPARLSADSIDSYGATFLSVVRAAWDAGPGLREYIRSVEPQLLDVAASVEAMRQPNGLTWSKPPTRVAYLEDNCEVYRGLTDLAYVEDQLGHVSEARRLSSLAARTKAAIESVLWQPSRNHYADFVDASGKVVDVKPTVWKSAVGELFPALYGVIDSRSERAAHLYSEFNGLYPHWPELDKPDVFAWALVADAAAIMHDDGRVARFAESVEATYGEKGFPWPWHVQESAFMVLASLHEMQPRDDARP
jgi:hypothetical protein